MIYDFLGQQEVAPSELIRQLPFCYSAEFDACIADYRANKPVTELSPFCRQYHGLYNSTSAAVWDAAMESMNYCPAPAAEKKKNFPLWLLGAGAAGLLLGTMIR